MQIALTFTIDYDIGTDDPSEALTNITRVLDHLAVCASSDGLLSGASDYLVTAWEYTIEPQE